MKQADLLVTAAQLVTCAPGKEPRRGSSMEELGVVPNGAMAVVGGLIAEVGPAADLLSRWQGTRLDHSGCVAPGLVDPHSHPLFGGSRTHEFLLRARGATYQEIHAAGGGILSTVRASREASDEELRRLTLQRLQRMLRHGSTTIEVKSGYGLSTDEELRHLRIYRDAQQHLPCELVPTFLGAHALAPEFQGRQDRFVEHIVQEMIPAVAEQGYAEFSDVFCEQGAFSCEQSRRILEASRSAGLKLKIHAEEFSYQGGARMAAELGAVSADHLQYLPQSDFAVLASAGTIPVMTAGTSFFLGMEQFAPARGLIAADLPLALGSDFNAGSCLSESMQMALALAVLKLKLTPAEALIAATVNAAHALSRGNRVGSLERDKKADFLLLDLQEIQEWPYHFGVNLVNQVYVKGVRVA